jgi:hypothetical protein
MTIQSDSIDYISLFSLMNNCFPQRRIPGSLTRVGAKSWYDGEIMKSISSEFQFNITYTESEPRSHFLRQSMTIQQNGRLLTHDHFSDACHFHGFYFNPIHDSLELNHAIFHFHHFSRYPEASDSRRRGIRSQFKSPTYRWGQSNYITHSQRTRNMLHSTSVYYT